MLSSYDSRFAEAILAHIAKEVDDRIDNLVVNRQSDARDVEYQRGYIACLKDLAISIVRDIPKKLNEG